MRGSESQHPLTFFGCRRMRVRRPALSSVFHLMTVAMMLVGMLASTTATFAAPSTSTSLQASAEQRPNTPPPYPAPLRVVAVGDFQAAVGCGGDWDKTCGATELIEQPGTGTWLGTFPVPPGSYSFRMVATSDIDRSLGEGADPEGQDLRLDVPDSAIGAAFAYTPATGRLVAAPVFSNLSLMTDLGNFSLMPTENGSFELFFPAPAGGWNIQVVSDGSPIGEPTQVSLDQDGVVHIEIDQSGQITAADASVGGQLAVLKTDEGGTPIPGSCFSVYDGNDLVSQSCDEDDGAPDGQITINFPEGFNPGTYTLAESRTPEGATPADDQDIDLQPGGNTAQISIAGGAEVPTEEVLPEDTPVEEQPTEEQPTEELPTEVPVVDLGTLVIGAVDQDGNPVGGVCYDITGIGSICDENGDGTMFWDETTPGELNVVVIGVPEGYELPTETQTVDVQPGAIVEIAFQVRQTAPAAGAISVQVTDADGNLLPGACVDVSGPSTLGFCDNDPEDVDISDGVFQFSDLEPGDYEVSLSFAPEGTEAGDSETVTVVAGELAQVTLVAAAPQPQTGAIVVTTVGEGGNLLAGACFRINDGDDVCDGDGSDADPNQGVVRFDNLEPGDYDVQMGVAPEGHSRASRQDVTVNVGEETAVTFVANLRPPPSGSLAITIENEAGDALSGACVTLAGTADVGQVCDNGEGDADPSEGTILIEGLAVGDYSVSQTQAIEGYAPAGDQAASIGDSEQTDLTLTQVFTIGSLTVFAVDGDGNPIGGACYTISTFGDVVCDEDGDGDMGLPETQAGEYTISVASAPEGYTVPTEEQTVTVEAGQAAEVTFTLAVATASVQIETTDDEGNPVGGACYLVGDVEVCDNDGTDRNPEEGLIVVTGLEPGTIPVEQTDAPEGFVVGEPQAIKAGAGEVAEVSLVNEPVPTEVPTETATLEPTATETATEEPTATLEPTATETATEEPSSTTVPDDTEVPATETATEEPTEAVPTETAVIVVPVGSGSIEITTEDEDGNPLTGACYQLSGAGTAGPVCDGGPDEGGADGVVRFEPLVAGNYTVTQTSAPEGYQGAGLQNISIADGEAATLTFTNTTIPLPTGAIQIVVNGADGNPVGGGCYSIASEAYCDNDTNDQDAANGSILVTGIQVGTYDVSESFAPSGLAAADPNFRTVEVVADETATGTFDHEALPPATGAMQIALEDPEGNPIEGGCVQFSLDWNLGSTTVCDNEDGDADPENGSIRLPNLPVGVYSVRVGDGAGFGDERTVTITEGETVPVVLLILPVATSGDLILTVLNEDASLTLPGACFTVTPNGGGAAIAICDNDGTDADNTPGVIRFQGLADGDYTLSQDSAPGGYEPAADQGFTIAGANVSITLNLVLSPDTDGSLTVQKFDEIGAPLAGACFTLLDGGVSVTGNVCDADDTADDGTILFADVEAGTYTLRETQLPSADYVTAADRLVTIIAGADDTTVEVPNTLKPGRLQIRKEDENGDLIGGTCFEITMGAAVYDLCDNDVFDANGTDGILRMVNLPVGDYEVTETLAPVGYDAADTVTVTVNANQTTFIRITNQPTPPPAETGTIEVRKVDGDGNALAGACFSLRVGAVTKVASTCDVADGANDGVITFAGVAVGNYTLHETVKPSAEYQTAADRAVTVTVDETTVVTVVNKLKTGRILVRKVNQDGDLLAGACFDLSPDGKGPKCTDGSGTVIFSQLEAGVYKMTETEAPIGYLAVEPRTGIVVNPGLTTTITVVNLLAPPPANTGSVRVIKFYCPAGKAGEFTLILDSTDPADSSLGKTVGCTTGDATFRLDPVKSGVANIEFSVGNDGTRQLIVPVGVYNFRELEPLLNDSPPTESTVVFKNQQTTLVVINYVKPPEPKPANIQVLKYTCDPGFDGVYYADFIANCGDFDQLTNGVTVRISGAGSGSRITGYGGVKGKAIFENLPLGTYILEEDAPATANSVYTFCGLTLDGAELKAVGPKLDFKVGSGQTMYCAFFNVPAIVTQDTGTITVHKQVCDANSYPANFDWYGQCASQGEGVKFTISRWNGQKYVAVSTAATNPDGLIQFRALQPGTYKLTEVGSTWCHAESDNVNAKGDLIVRAGMQTAVWIFNCVETRNPPNTGTGATVTQFPAASIPVMQGPKGPSTLMLLGAVWPLVGYAVYRRRRAA